MAVLAELLSSRVRAEVLRLLFGVTSEELHGREIARRSDCSEATLRQELGRLRHLDLVTARRSGNRVYYRANRDHPLYPELHRLVLKTGGLVDVMRTALEGAEIELAFVFGSLADGAATATSDVDLMVIGSLRLRELTSLLEGVAETLGREVNPHVMTAAEYQDRRARGDHFVRQVLRGDKLFIIGDQRELEAMARARLAEA